MRSSAAVVILGIVLAGTMGCGNKDQGTLVTDEDIAKTKAAAAADAEQQILKVQNDPNIPANQKERIIGTIRAGAARAAAGTQSGKASSTKK